MFNIGGTGVESAKRMLSVFSLGEVVKLMMLHFLKVGSYTHCPVVNRLLPVPGSGILWCVAHRNIGLK